MKMNKIIRQTGVGILGMGVIAANGVFMLTQDSKDIPFADPVPIKAQAYFDNEVKYEIEDEAALEQNAALTVSAAELPQAKNLNKASIDDYRMLLQADRKKTPQEINAAKKFDKVYDIDTTKIYDPKPEPLNFTKTRSVAQEYFTVHDIISGGDYTLNAHEMICEMVYSEIGSEWDEEAIKAQAVAAYTYLRFNESIDRTPDVGLKQGYPEKIEKCVSAVEGQAVFYDGKIINAVYSASTAGYSVESERIWEVYYPYLRAVVSEYDKEDPNYALEYTFTTYEMKQKLESACGVEISDDPKNWFQIEDVYSGRYVGFINVDGKKRITARTLQETLDLKSQAFTVKVTDSNVVIHTYGWGHGVGMSQWGACFYAKHGYTYDQILRHYYLNTTIQLSKVSRRAVNRGSASASASESGSQTSEEQ